MTIAELQELTDHHFDFIIPAADGQILFAGPLPDEYGEGLPNIPTDGSSLNLDETGLYAWEDAWERYISSLTPKRRNRTRKQAAEQGAITKMPENLAIITAPKYLYAMTTKKDKTAYLQPIVQALAETLQRNYETLQAKGEIENINFVQYYDNSPQAVSNLDIPTLWAIYTIFFDRVLKQIEADPDTLMQKVSSPTYKKESITLYISEFLRMIGYAPNHNRADEEAVIGKIASYANIYGVMTETIGTTKYKSHYPVLQLVEHDAKTNTVEIMSPYMNKLIMTILQASVQRGTHDKPKLKRDGTPLMDPSHAWLVKAEISKERNKRAVMIVDRIIKVIVRRGDGGPSRKPPNIMVKTIIDDCPDIKNALENAKSAADKNKILKRAFSKAWELLETKTTLREHYKNIKFPTLIPTVSTMDTLLEFPHDGTIKNQE